MRILAMFTLATVLGVAGAYTIRGKSSPQPQPPTHTIFRIAEIPKADAARIATIAAQSVEAITPPAHAPPQRIAATTPPAHDPPSAKRVTPKARPKAATSKTTKATPPKAKPKTAAARKPNST